MMTINDMLEQGTTMQGFVVVLGVNASGHESTLHESACEWACGLAEEWADAGIRYMYVRDDKLFIEVDYEEREEPAMWACPDCAEWWHPEDGPILVQDRDGALECPKCGCTTYAPEEDACYKVEG